MTRKGRAEGGPSSQHRQNASSKLRNCEKAYSFLELRQFFQIGVVACTAGNCMGFITVRPCPKARN